MPSNEPTKKSQSVLEFAVHLQKYLDERHNSLPQPFPDVSIYVEALPLPLRDISPAQRLEFDRVGVAIWNHSRTLRQNVEDNHNPIDIAKVSAFAYLVLETATTPQQKGNHRLFNCGLKAARDCLAHGLIDTGARIAEQLASKLEIQMPSEQDHPVSNVFRTQYLLLRVLLAWKQDRLEFAEHFYRQLEDLQLAFTPRDRQQSGDLCYEIGNDQMNRGQANLARQWLHRGCGVCGSQDQLSGDVDMSELRLNLMHMHVRALLASNDLELGDEVMRALELLRADFGDKLPVMILQLEVYARDPQPNQVVYYAVLMDVIRSVHLIPTNHKLILNHVHQLRSVSVGHAAKALKTYVVVRLALHDELYWVETGLLTFIWMVTTDPADPASISQLELESFLNEVYQVWNKTLSPEATHGALVVGLDFYELHGNVLTAQLFWKRIGGTVENDKQIQWCRIALHQMLSNAGDHNIGKLERRMIKCFLDLSDFDAAAEIFQHMPASRKNHHLSRFLWYSLALRRQDDNSVQSALGALASVHDGHNRLLFAAVSEAMKYGTKLQGAQLLQRILDKYNGTASPEIDTPALLRCTGRLLLSAIVEEECRLEELLSRLCAIFRSAVDLSQKASNQKESSTALSIDDCKWFEWTGFQAALEHVKTWPTKYIIDLLHHSCQIQYPEDSLPTCRVEKVIHEIDSSCIQAILYLAEARACSPSSTIADIPKSSYSNKAPPLAGEIQSTLYRNVFTKYSHSRQQFDALSEDSLDTDIMKDATQKLIGLLPFAFESMLFLTTQAQVSSQLVDMLSLNQLIDYAVKLKVPEKAYSLMVDMILSSVTIDTKKPMIEGQDSRREPGSATGISTTCAAALLSKLVDSIRNETTYGVSQASRWIRCVVQLILDQHSISNKTTSGKAKLDCYQRQAFQTVKKISEQALALAKSINPCVSMSTPDHLAMYPVEEIEWLASTLFNLSIDILYWDKHADQAIDGVTKQLGDQPRSEERPTFDGSDTRPQTHPNNISGTNAESGAAPDARAAGTVLAGDASHHSPGIGNPNGRSRDVQDDTVVTSPQRWASLALQLADLLDTNLGSPAGDSQFPPAPDDSRASVGAGKGSISLRRGDGGALARVIRERCRMLGWGF